LGIALLLGAGLGLFVILRDVALLRIERGCGMRQGFWLRLTTMMV
jgi:hypothetical protein